MRVAARPVILLSLVLGTLYLYWRASSTFHGTNKLLFGLVLALEVLVFVRYTLRALPVALGSRKVISPSWDNESSAMIGVVVTDEAISQVRLAIRSAQEVQRVSAVVVVNAHNRSDVRDQAARMGVIELDCSGPHNIGSSVWQLVREADDELLAFVPGYAALHPEFLRYSGGHFADPSVGAVSFPVQLVGATGIAGGSGYRLASDADAAFAVALDAHGAAAAQAGPLLCRKSALAEISDAPVGAGSLELQICLELQKREWIVRVGPLGLARRRAPWSEDRALRDRARLVASRFYLSQNKSLSTKDLPSGLQRIPYLLARLDIGSAIVRLIAVLLPPLVAITGQIPFSARLADVFFIAVPWFLTSALGRRLIAVGDEPLGSELRRGIRTLPVDLHVLRSKGASLPGAGESVRWQFRVAILLIVSAGLSAALPFTSIANELPTGVKFVVVGSAVVSLTLVRDLMWAATDRERRVLARAPLGNVASASGAVSELSPLGVDLHDDRPFDVGERVEVALELPLTGNRTWKKPVAAVVQRCFQVGTGYVAYAEFDIGASAFDELLYFCSITADATKDAGLAVEPVAGVVRDLPGGHQAVTGGSVIQTF